MDTYLSEKGNVTQTNASLEKILEKIGTKLYQAFLERSAVEIKLCKIINNIQEDDLKKIHLALNIEDELTNLPWETLKLSPDLPPVSLCDKVMFYREIPEFDSNNLISILGPLRILIAIASPENQKESGELLDMERELEFILDAVKPARKEGEAYLKRLSRICLVVNYTHNLRSNFLFFYAENRE